MKRSKADHSRSWDSSVEQHRHSIRIEIHDCQVAFSIAIEVTRRPNVEPRAADRKAIRTIESRDIDAGPQACRRTRGHGPAAG